MPKPQDPAQRAKIQRRRRKRARQSVVFGVLIATMALAGLGATAVYSGAISLPFAREFSSDKAPADPALTPPCLTEERRNPAAYNKVKVRIYNSSERRGLASTVAKSLEGRGFHIVTTGNLSAGVNDARISFGHKGLVRAYTLAAHLPDVQLLYDDRSGATVDLIVGQSFEALIPEDAVRLQPKIPMENLPGCVPLDTMTPSAAIVPESLGGG
ncbi:LytR cell envelope-related transcriptional attenuator [Micrococcales bacterium KH10]|nr:LytR cell envelope-related transcriptional attenuator [Micrococcales bacterium KH10]